MVACTAKCEREPGSMIGQQDENQNQNPNQNQKSKSVFGSCWFVIVIIFAICSRLAHRAKRRIRCSGLQAAAAAVARMERTLCMSCACCCLFVCSTWFGSAPSIALVFPLFFHCFALGRDRAEEMIRETRIDTKRYETRLSIDRQPQLHFSSFLGLPNQVTHFLAFLVSKPANQIHPSNRQLSHISKRPTNSDTCTCLFSYNRVRALKVTPTLSPTIRNPPQPRIILGSEPPKY